MKPRHFLLTLLALLTSITASAHEWTDANGTVWNFGTSGSCAFISNRGYNNGYIPSISGAIPTDLTIPATVYIGETPYAVTSIGDNAFQGCSSLTSINIPDGVTSIESNAFNCCSSLTSINIPEGVTSIGGAAFLGCSSLTSINIPDGVTSIGGDAFNGCSSLTSITVPSSVETIGGTAFGSHYMVVTFNSATPCNQSGLGESVRLVVPHAGVDAYREAWSAIANVIVDADHIEKTVDVTANESASAVAEAIGEDLLKNVLRLKVKGTFNSYDVMVFRNKMINLTDLDLSDANVVASSYAYYQTYKTKDNIITGYFAPTKIISFRFPKDITALESSAFYGCRQLRTVTLPEGITTIPYNAFYQCNNLTSINIPESVTSIERYAFSYCT